MNTPLILLFSALVAWFIYGGVTLVSGVRTSKHLISVSKAYTKEGIEGTNDVLVIGDSTAVGVGASSSEETLAGLVSNYIDASTVENYAKSGAVTEDLVGQITKAQKRHYSLILIQIGGNDIIQLKSKKKAVENLSNALSVLPESDKVIVISAGNVGGAPLLPFLLRPMYTRTNIAFHEAFEQAVTAMGGTYVNLYTAPGANKIEEQPEIYLAADGLHPSSAGYKVWFDAIRPELESPRKN